MSFESFSAPDPVEVEKEESKDFSGEIIINPNSEGVTKSMAERINKWLRIAAIIGVSFTAGKFTYDQHEKNVEYDNYLETTLTPEDSKELDALNHDIAKYFGDGALDRIKSADKSGYFKKKEMVGPQKTEISGFYDIGLPKQLVDLMLGGELFPKNWVDGEVKNISYTDAEDTKAHAAYVSFFDSIYFFNKTEWKSDISPADRLDFIKDMLGHELGHANAWDSDTESDIKTRTKLLFDVMKRLNAEDRIDSIWSRKNAMGKVEKKDLYKYAQEYWAEVCNRYFSFPEFLRLEHKADFDLVNNYVLSQDPTFNVFEKAGPYFDRDGNPTQKILDKIK